MLGGNGISGFITMILVPALVYARSVAPQLHQAVLPAPEKLGGLQWDQHTVAAYCKPCYINSGWVHVPGMDGRRLLEI